MRARQAIEAESLTKFEGLVREHQAGLRAFIRAIGVDEIWVDDVAQEAFLIAYRRLGEFESGTDFGKWLRAIARNLAANERRKEARRSRLLPAAVADVLLRQDTEKDMIGQGLGRLIESLNDCVGKLSPRSRELLHRRYQSGSTSRSLALELGMKPDALRQALLRIRLAVKKCIEEAHEGALP